MTGRAVCTAHWRRLDGEGTDRCTLGEAEHGWLLSGQAVWREEGAESALAYAVRCDPGWQSLSADVAGTSGGRAVALRLVREAAGWRLNEALQEGTAGCADLDLCFTPATNLLPLRRLDLGESPVPVAAAWLVPGLDAVRRLEQSYARLGEDRFRYDSPGFSAALTVHPSGFVTRYEGLWEGWVDAA